MKQAVDGATPSAELGVGQGNPAEALLAEAHFANGGEVILFDGVCNLCNASVLFVIRHDPNGHFSFAPLQSPEAATVLAARGYAADSRSASVLLIQGNHVYDRSSAALRIARRLSGAWPLISVVLLIPQPIRDAVYDWIARNRYRLFGRQEACRVPNPELRSRFFG